MTKNLLEIGNLYRIFGYNWNGKDEINTAYDYSNTK